MTFLIYSLFALYNYIGARHSGLASSQPIKTIERINPMDLNLEIVMCKCGTIINEDTFVRELFQETHSIDKLFIKSSKFNDSPLIHRTIHNRQFLLILQRVLLLLLIVRRYSSTRKILYGSRNYLKVSQFLFIFFFQRNVVTNNSLLLLTKKFYKHEERNQYWIFQKIFFNSSDSRVKF